MAAKRAAAPAKLSPPRLVQALPRERLFDWLDAHRERPGLWLAGPPGAGKTTLAAGWLQARALPFLWYRLDADDNELAVRGSTFEELFADVQTKAGIVVTFLALLEMIRLKLVRVFQQGGLGPIRVYKREKLQGAPEFAQE